MKKHVLLTTMFLLTVSSRAWASCELTTTFASNGGFQAGGAAYFDVTVYAQDLEITGFAVNTYDPWNGQTFAFEVYTTPNTYVGKENNPGLWILRATGTGVYMGYDVPSPVTLNGNFTLDANATTGIAIVLVDARQRRTTGSGHYQNGHVALDLGALTFVPFTGTVFTPRTWNGTIFYRIGSGRQGDIDGDGDTDFDDLNLFVAVLIGIETNGVYVTRSDMDGSGTADGLDIALFLPWIVDITPPTPNPLAFSRVPVPIVNNGDNQVFMMVTTATDPGCLGSSQVYYQFEEATSGPSAWQADHFYFDVGLAPNTLYTYRVRARDDAPSQNATQWSPPSDVATRIEAPQGIAAGTITSTSIELTAQGVFSNLTAGDSGIYYQWWLSASGSYVGASGWNQTPTFVLDNLLPNTEYRVRAKARNLQQVQTDDVEDNFTTAP